MGLWHRNLNVRIAFGKLCWESDPLLPRDDWLLGLFWKVDLFLLSFLEAVFKDVYAFVQFLECAILDKLVLKKHLY